MVSIRCQDTGVHSMWAMWSQPSSQGKSSSRLHAYIRRFLTVLLNSECLKGLMKPDPNSQHQTEENSGENELDLDQDTSG